VSENNSDRAYTWTVRTLYVVGLGLNAAWMYRQFSESPEGQIAIRQTKRHLERMVHPVRVWRDFHASRQKVINSAEVTVRLAAEEEE
jgi:hypothetical protein